MVTRTRKRGGTRTAGHAPVSADVPESVPESLPESVEAEAIDAALGVPPADGLVEPGTADTEPGSDQTAAHVPIKRKGRKR